MPFLFERLDPAAFDLRSAIRAQVERIVSARLVDTAAERAGEQEFGMPSIVDLNSGDSAALAAYARRLCRQIGLYEPRLLHPQVELLPQTDAMMPNALMISGTLRSGAAEERFAFSLARRSGP